jgi:RHS repeat-associated protein
VYDAANELTSWNGQPVTYDPNGSLTNDGTNAYTWNARNQLVSVNPITTGSSLTFGYDPLGRRDFLGTGTSPKVHYLYDGLNPVFESDGRHQLTGLGLDEYLRLDGTSVFFPSVYPLADALGSVVALTDSTGTVITQYTYDSFGNTSSAGAAVGNQLEYTGRENDGRGLYYFRARYYHPTFGRFIGEDPLGIAGGDVNLYAYVGGSPTRFTDQIGLCPTCVTAAIGGAIGAASGGVNSILEGHTGVRVLEDAAEGAAVGAVQGFFPTSAILNSPLGAAGVAFASDLVGSYLQEGHFDYGSALGSAVSGYFGGYVGQALERAAAGEIAETALAGITAAEVGAGTTPLGSILGEKLFSSEGTSAGGNEAGVMGGRGSGHEGL